jgi:hypothetical protein
MIPILSQDTTLAVEGRNERLIKQGEIFNKLILSKKPDINNIMEKVWKIYDDKNKTFEDVGLYPRGAIL